MSSFGTFLNKQFRKRRNIRTRWISTIDSLDMEEFSRKSTIHIVKGQTDLCILTYFFHSKIYQFNVKGNLLSYMRKKSYFLVSTHWESFQSKHWMLSYWESFVFKHWILRFWFPDDIKWLMHNKDILRLFWKWGQ